jgi:hypothetical protein
MELMRKPFVKVQVFMCEWYVRKREGEMIYSTFNQKSNYLSPLHVHMLSGTTLCP